MRTNTEEKVDREDENSQDSTLARYRFEWSCTSK